MVFFKVKNSQAYLFIFIYLIKFKFNAQVNNTPEKFSKKKLDFFYNKITKLFDEVKRLKIDLPIFYLWASTPELMLCNISKYKLLRIKYLQGLKNIQLKEKNKLFDFKIIEPFLLAKTIGTSIHLDALIKSQILGFDKTKKYIFPITKNLKKQIANQSLINYFKKYIDVVDEPEKADYFYSFKDDLRATYDESISCNHNIVPHAHSSGVLVNTYWENKSNKPLFELTLSHKNNGNKILEKIGLKTNDWFAVSHVRESSYKGAENFRDSDIETYFKAYKNIVSKGGWIIRIGDNKMKRLPKMNRVIDYAHSEFKSDWMDIFLCAQAKFMIGTSSGPSVISYIFGTPVALTNNLPSSAIYLGSKDLFIPRLMKYKNNKSFVKLVDSLTPPFSIGYNDGMYSNILKVDLIPNTEIEIDDLCNEMFNKVFNNYQYSDSEKNLQEKFKDETAKNEILIGLKGKKILCNIGINFLKQNYLLNNF